MFIIFMLQFYLTPSLLSIDVIKRVEDRKNDECKTQCKKLQRKEKVK